MMGTDDGDETLQDTDRNKVPEQDGRAGQSRTERAVAIRKEG